MNPSGLRRSRYAVVMNVRRGLIGVGGVALLVGLAACSMVPSIGVADERRPGTPAGVEIAPFTEGPVVVAYDDGGVDVVTWGSSSCPAMATSVEKKDGEFIATFETPSEGPCTADMGPTTHVFTAASIGSTVPDTSRLIFSDFDDEQTVEVTRVSVRGAVVP